MKHAFFERADGFRGVDGALVTAAGRTNAPPALRSATRCDAVVAGAPAKPVNAAALPLVSRLNWRANVADLRAWWSDAAPGACYCYAYADYVCPGNPARDEAWALYGLGLAELAMRRGGRGRFYYLIIKRAAARAPERGPIHPRAKRKSWAAA